MLVKHCPNLTEIELRTPSSPDPTRIIMPLRLKLARIRNILLRYTAHKQHPRCYRYNHKTTHSMSHTNFRFSNGWTVLADRGLNIFGDYASNGTQDTTSNGTYFVFCPPGAKGEEPEEEQELASLKLCPDV